MNCSANWNKMSKNLLILVNNFLKKYKKDQSQKPKRKKTEEGVKVLLKKKVLLKVTKYRNCQNKMRRKRSDLGRGQDQIRRVKIKMQLKARQALFR